MNPTFKPTSDSQAIRERLWALFAARERGELVTVPEIENATGSSHDEHGSRYWPLVKWLRGRHQSERGISIINQRLVGESLATHEEQLLITPKQNRRASRAIRRGRRAAEALPYAELTQHQAMIKDSQIAEAREQDRKLRESKERWNFLMRPMAPDPVRVRIAETEEEPEKATA